MRKATLVSFFWPCPPAVPMHHLQGVGLTDADLQVVVVCNLGVDLELFQSKVLQPLTQQLRCCDGLVVDVGVVVRVDLLQVALALGGDLIEPAGVLRVHISCRYTEKKHNTKQKL